MTVQEQVPYQSFTANGKNTTFYFSFYVEDIDNLVVRINGEVIEYGLYTYIKDENAIQFFDAPEANQVIELLRKTALEREVDYDTFTNQLRPETLNKDLDKIWLKLQEMGIIDDLLENRIDNLKTYVDHKDTELKSYLLEEIRKQGVALDQLENYYNYLMQKLAEIAVNGGWLDSAVATWSGRTQESKNKDFINVKDYGVIGDGTLHTVNEWIPSKFENLAAIQVAYPHVTSLTDSIDWAAFQKAFQNDVNVYANDGLFILNRPLVVGKQLRKFVGSGHGAWDTVFHNRVKTWDGTNLIFTDLVKNNTIKGITSQALFGGSRPDITDPTMIYNLTSFMQKDGTNTARPFSSAISFEWNVDSGTNAQILEGFRLVPSNGLSDSDHISDYNTTSDSLGADIDVGIYRLNTEYNQIRNFQVVGYWRKAAVADIQTAQETWGRGERNTLENGTLQGFVGLLERASDVQTITAYTSDSFTIPYFDEQYFNNTGSAQLGTLSGYYSWSGVTVDSVGGTITFTGVTPEITTNVMGYQFRSFYRGTGKAATRYLNLMIHGLNHKSGKTGKELGFTEFTRAHEVSGFPVRGTEYFTVKCQMTNDEPLSAFYGNMTDAQFYGCQHEVGRVIASPQNITQTWAEHPAWDTRAIRMYSWIANDKTMFTPRTFYDDQEFFQMSDLSGIYRVKFPSDRSSQVVKETGQYLSYYNNTTKMGGWTAGGNFEVDGSILANSIIDLTATTGNIRSGGTNTITMFSSSGTVAPSRGDAVQSLGSSTARWNTIYTKSINNSSTVSIQWGSGSPEGAITAAVGSMYLRTDGGSNTTLYIKQSGSSNTGWAAK